MRRQIVKLTANRSFSWLTRWRPTTDKSSKPAQPSLSFPKDTPWGRFFSRFSKVPKTSQTACSSPSTSETVNVSCPTCAQFWEEVQLLELNKLSEGECQDLMTHFQSTDYALYRRVLVRSLPILAQRLEVADDPMETFRLQGQCRQRRIDLALPIEIEQLLEEFAKADERLKTMKEQEEKMKNERR
jgi:hypothetical protein